MVTMGGRGGGGGGGGGGGSGTIYLFFIEDLYIYTMGANCMNMLFPIFCLFSFKQMQQKISTFV